MNRSSHAPMRTCMGCNGRAPQPALLRIACAADGALELVRVSGYSGRTGYLHRRPDCWKRFAARQGRLRSLGRTVDREVRRGFVEELQQAAQLAMITR